MSEPSIVQGQYLNILLGDGATPTEVFTMICGLTTRSFTEQSNTTDSFVRDCAVPDGVPRRRVQVTGEQWDLTGTGLFNRAQLPLIRAARGLRKNWRFNLGQPTGDVVSNGGGFFAGSALLESIRYVGEDGNFATLDIAIKSDGAWTFTVVP